VAEGVIVLGLDVWCLEIDRVQAAEHDVVDVDHLAGDVIEDVRLEEFGQFTGFDVCRYLRTLVPSGNLLMGVERMGKGWSA
jgi:hypothetical protein